MIGGAVSPTLSEYLNNNSIVDKFKDHARDNFHPGSRWQINTSCMVWDTIKVEFEDVTATGKMIQAMHK